MKRALAFLVTVLAVVGCSTAPVVPERMVIAPDTIVFRAPTTDSTVSITHTCTCPFTWSATVSPASVWLNFPTYQSGDKNDVPISIDRAELTADTTRATITLASNSYGDTSIVVIAIR